VHTLLISIFGEYIHLQLSEVHLCADVVSYDFSQCSYETQFVRRVRKNEAIYGADSVALDCHRASTLAFSKHKAPISCSIYNKPLTIEGVSKLFQRLRKDAGIEGKRYCRTNVGDTRQPLSLRLVEALLMYSDKWGILVYR
jgi:hypothetical protein